MNAQDLAASPVPLGDFLTPLVTLDMRALDHNTNLLASWAQSVGVQLAPHGKTSMAPSLWNKMLTEGAWGLTVATTWQAQVAKANGVKRVMIANEVASGPALDWVCSVEDLDLYIWVDSLAGLRLIEQRKPERPVKVLVDLGGEGGRTGVVDVARARELGQAATQSPYVQLVGIAGYEGAFAHTRSADDLQVVRDYCAVLVEAYRELSNLWETAAPVVTASGSTFYDVIAAQLVPALPEATIVLRPGSFQPHDGGYYSRVSPFGKDFQGERLKTALHGWATVISRPEPTRVLLDGGRRDFSFDIDLPQISPDDERLNGPARSYEINDQHLFVEVCEDSTLQVGDRVRLDLSHPCTTFDKWRLIPVVQDDLVVGAVETWF